MAGPEGCAQIERRFQDYCAQGADRLLSAPPPKLADRRGQQAAFSRHLHREELLQQSPYLAGRLIWKDRHSQSLRPWPPPATGRESRRPASGTSAALTRSACANSISTSWTRCCRG